MSEPEAFEIVAYDEDGIVIFIPSPWEQVDNNEGLILFQHENGLEVQVERLLLDRSEESPVAMSEIELLRSRDDPEMELVTPPVVLVSGAAMMSYRLEDEDRPDSVYLCCELCRYLSPMTLAVIRFVCSVEVEDLDNLEVVYWSHVFRQMARMTEFPEFEDEILPA
jgi:hypothetical protein